MTETDEIDYSVLCPSCEALDICNQMKEDGFYRRMFI